MSLISINDNIAREHYTQEAEIYMNSQLNQTIQSNSFTGIVSYNLALIYGTLKVMFEDCLI